MPHTDLQTLEPHLHIAPVAQQGLSTAFLLHDLSVAGCHERCKHCSSHKANGNADAVRTNLLLIEVQSRVLSTMSFQS